MLTCSVALDVEYASPEDVLVLFVKHARFGVIEASFLGRRVAWTGGFHYLAYLTLGAVRIRWLHVVGERLLQQYERDQNESDD